VSTTCELQNHTVTRPILGVNVAVSSYEKVVQNSILWAEEQQPRVLFFTSVHMVMEAVDDSAFLGLLNAADLVLPDGMPIAWALRLLGQQSAQQVCGPDTTTAMLAAAEKEGVSVGFYGGKQSVLDDLIRVVHLRYPNLNVVFAESPPFRTLTAEEDLAIVDRIASSGTRLLFVGLGCPKQEYWIMEHVGRLPVVMLAVGAAFDFIAGSKRRAPRWMSSLGLEWVFRFATEPRRLAMRYLKHNPRFVILLLRQLLSSPA
jgi:N-acetylglucosaminyldiphosphoundecaprenol N-acetyl-beta-D-mannosaminyltransferase